MIKKLFAAVMIIALMAFTQDACAAPESFYMDGRGTRFDSGRGATGGPLFRHIAP